MLARAMLFVFLLTAFGSALAQTRPECTKYLGKGYGTDYIKQRVGQVLPGNAAKWKGNINLNQVQLGDVAIFNIGSAGHVAFVEKVHHKDGQPVSVYLSEMNWGPLGNCDRSDNFNVVTYRTVAIQKVARVWRSTNIVDKAVEIIKPGESRYSWALDTNGSVTFEGQVITTAGDPPSAELRFSKGSPNEAFRYAILVDTDKGALQGFVWRQNTKAIVARIQIPGTLLSDTIFWSGNETRAIVIDAGEVQENIHIINLQTGRVTKHGVGQYRKDNCEIQWLYGQPAKWVGESVFRLNVKIEKNPWEDGPCRAVKPRSIEIDVPVQ